MPERITHLEESYRKKLDKSRNWTKVVVCSDIHAGSKVAVSSIKNDTPIQREINKRKDELVAKHKSPDILVCNGDGIEGLPKKKQASVWTADLQLQQTDFTDLLLEWKAKAYWFVQGTGTHVDNEEGFSYEEGTARQVARHFPVGRYSEDRYVHYVLHLNVHDRILRFRHKIGNTTVPYGIATDPLKKSVNNCLNATHGTEPLADYLLFGHVHRFSCIRTSRYNVVTLPGWKAVGDKYGETNCDGYVDVGLVIFYINKKTGKIILDWDVESIIAPNFEKTAEDVFKE